MSAASVLARPKPAARQHGLAFWMDRVLEECDRASVEFAADPVHDLRVALRRCRSMADGLMAMDPDPSWKQMKKSGRLLFRSLGELRDVQIMEEWIGKLASSDDPVAMRLLQYLAARGAHLKQQAAEALHAFDQKQWKRWIRSLSRRAARIRSGSLIFQHLALERWSEAQALHQKALRNRSQVAFHSLRIGIKRFRYIVENFLPEQHQKWGGDLKELQDLLGEVHDLDILWATALQIEAFTEPESRSRWRARIQDERSRRIHRYKSKMVGPASLWPVWRAQLPSGKQQDAATLARLKLWASFLDPDLRHSTRVAQLAVQLYDRLPARPAPASVTAGEREIVRAASLLHDVGRLQKEKNHQKATYRLIGRLKAPLGWNTAKVRMVAAVARYHRGALPRAGQKALADFLPAQRQAVIRLAGILRLANALDGDHSGRIRRIAVEETNGVILLSAEGYEPKDRLAEEIAAARHLLEIVYRRPLLVRAMDPNRRSRKPVISRHRALGPQLVRRS